jgi:hypothetical protein
LPPARSAVLSDAYLGATLRLVTDEDDFVQTANYAGRRAALRHAVQEGVISL